MSKTEFLVEDGQPSHTASNVGVVFGVVASIFACLWLVQSMYLTTRLHEEYDRNDTALERFDADMAQARTDIAVCRADLDAARRD